MHSYRYAAVARSYYISTCKKPPRSGQKRRAGGFASVAKGKHRKILTGSVAACVCAGICRAEVRFVFTAVVIVNQGVCLMKRQPSRIPIEYLESLVEYYILLAR